MPKKNTPKEPVTFDLDDLYLYKLLHLQGQVNTLKEAIAKPLSEAFQKALYERLDAAFKENEPLAAAQAAFNECTEDVAASVKIPKGYEVTGIDLDNKKIVATPKPKQKKSA